MTGGIISDHDDVIQISKHNDLSNNSDESTNSCEISGVSNRYVEQSETKLTVDVEFGETTDDTNDSGCIDAAVLEAELEANVKDWEEKWQEKQNQQKQVCLVRMRIKSSCSSEASPLELYIMLSCKVAGTAPKQS